MKSNLNFFVQSTEAERFAEFLHQVEMDLARQFGATFKHFTPDSCDMIFPSKESMEAFEKARKDYLVKYGKNNSDNFYIKEV